jgi:hypothetical protein
MFSDVIWIVASIVLFNCDSVLRYYLLVSMMICAEAVSFLDFFKKIMLIFR